MKEVKAEKLQKMTDFYCNTQEKVPVCRSPLFVVYVLMAPRSTSYISLVVILLSLMWIALVISMLMKLSTIER